jgi:hypothetical protein
MTGGIGMGGFARVQSAVCIVVGAAMLSGCMTTEFFRTNAVTLSDTDVCTARDEGRSRPQQELYWMAGREMDRRGMTDARCDVLLAQKKQQLQNGLAIVAAGLAVVAVANASRRPGGGGAGYEPVQMQDYQWAWDQFYNDQFQLVWACRGVQTGQFAELYRCNGLLQIDNKWPSKSAKLNF